MKDEKILQDEILSEEQLEEVVGGSTGEFIRDTQLMKALKLIPSAYNAKQLNGSNFGKVNDMMNGVLAKYNLKIEASANGANSYFSLHTDLLFPVAPTKLSRADFCQMLCENTGHADFNYSKYL